MAIRLGRNGTRTEDIISPAIHNNGYNFITWSNIWIRGAVSGHWTYNCEGYNVISNKITVGDWKLFADTVKNSQFIGNDLTADLYGYTNCGAWHGSGAMIDRTQQYYLSKYSHGSGNVTTDDGISLHGSCSNVIIAYNHVYNQAGECIHFLIDAPGSTNCQVFSNVVELCSDVGVMVGYPNNAHDASAHHRWWLCQRRVDPGYERDVWLAADSQVCTNRKLLCRPVCHS